MSENNKIRVRFAPSPTGFMHIGNFRSALYDYLFVKKHGGDFVLRIEDTDQKRFVPGALESLIKVLDWADIKYNEGTFQAHTQNKEEYTSVISKNYPDILEVGEFGPYIQSERLDLYKKYAEQLVAEGKAYYCFCEPARLEQVREEQQKNKIAPMYDRYCLINHSAKEINQKLKENCPATIRLKVPKDEIIEFEDIVRGKVRFNSSVVDDQVLLKSDGFPTYHLANVVDDHLMKITHVIRGEEWLPSTPKHILLYRAFGWKQPQFAHLPLLLNPDKSKLSKRQGDVAVEDYIKKGYLKEAIINFVALLGWNPGDGSTQEIFSLEELVEKFELSKVHKAGAVFDIKKLDWLNAQYIKQLSDEKLLENAKPFFKEKKFYLAWERSNETLSDDEKDEYLRKVLTIEKQRLNKFSDVGDENIFFFEDISYDKNLLRWKENSDEQTKNSLEKARDILSDISKENWNLKDIEEKLLEAAGDKRGDFLWPLRSALTGQQKSPSPFEVSWVLGRDESLARLEKAIAML